MISRDMSHVLNYAKIEGKNKWFTAKIKQAIDFFIMNSPLFSSERQLIYRDQMPHITLRPSGGLPAQGFPWQQRYYVPANGKWTSHQGDYIYGLHGPNTGLPQCLAGGGSYIYLAAVSAEAGGHQLVLLRMAVSQIKDTGNGNQHRYHYRSQR